MDVTNSLNFYVGGSADVGDMLSMDRLLVSVTPRFFACNENRISVSPMYMEVG